MTTEKPNGRRHGGRKSPGFALIVTLMLMILLAILCVSLLGLSSIALRTHSGSSELATARANAHFALLIAIGDLQNASGDDRKVTATADIAGKSDGTSLPVGEDPGNAANLDGTAKNLSRIQSGTRHWTGVFRNADSPSSIYTKTPAAQLERWLVSGNSSPAVTPALASCAVSSDGKVADPKLAAVLVGPRTVGTGAGSASGYVAAPIVPVAAKPGELSGGYAYWIGDEGVKARIDMERSNDDSASYAALVAQRRGWETVEGLSAYPTPQGDADSSLRRVITLPTSGLLLPSMRGGNPSPEQKIFHSATVSSRGLLANSLQGGLRVDLSAAFGSDLPASAPTGAFESYPVKGGRVIPATAFSELQHLTWDHLKEFHGLRSQMKSGKLIVRERTGPSTTPITPMIVDFRILMGVRAKPATTDPASTSFTFNPCGKLAVTLANPYPFPLVWEKDLELEVQNQTPTGNAPARIWQYQGNCVFITRYPNDEPAVFNQAMFTIAKGQLEPGEARAYTVASNVLRPKLQATSRVVVPMAPFLQAVPFDFGRCVEVDTGFNRNLPQTIDVRESWQTTLVALEMRFAGSAASNTWLQRIEGCELDNAYFSPNNRTFNMVDTPTLKGPVPLMLYSYQISQPGMDYVPFMPAGYQMGQRASTIRTFSDFNLRAGIIHKTIASYNPPPFFTESNNSRSQLAFLPGGDTGTGFTRNLVANPLNWGHSGVSGSNKAVLFTVPSQLASLAQFQHADLTNDAGSLSIGHQPGNAFGNSYATPFVKRDLVRQNRCDYTLMGSPNRSGALQTPRTYFDISHILNNSLWDRYFFSTIPAASTVPQNPTLTVSASATAVDLRDPQKAASGLMVEGAFNINSTDKNAWKVFLASSRHFKHPSDTAIHKEATFPRSLEQPTAHALPATGKQNDSYSGYRRLSDAELDALATEIAKQVRRRGPFVSLSHFVNRALVDIGKDPELSRSGALQLALDESGVNISLDGSRSAFKDIQPGFERVTLAQKQGQPRADFDGGDLGGRPASFSGNLGNVEDWAMTSTDNNFGAVAGIVADRGMLMNGTGSPTALEREQGYRSTGIPGWVTQADVLQVIGPSISARSDTFRIRTMGQARDAAGKVVATAYCEAIVQRTAAFVDPSDPAHTPTDTRKPTNQKFGRKFEVVSFRWLSPDEI